MKSKVILFCVLLFCSKIVDSIPHSEDLVGQRVKPISNWQVNQNAPNGQYLETDFTQTRNVNIQQEKTQDYYSNQERYNYDSNGYNRSPASSPSGEDLLANYDSPADGRRLDSYPPRVESYPSRTSQVGFDNQQYRNQNWRSQNQYTNSAPSAVLIPDHERPLVTTVQEPYRVPVQYLQPKYVPSSNQRFYQPGRSYLTREQFQYPLTGDIKYVANSAPRFGSSGPVSYDNYNEDQVEVASEIKARPTGGRRHVQSFTPQSGIIYKKAPAVVATETLTDQSGNTKYLENYKSRSHLTNNSPITNYSDGSPVITQADNYSSDSGASNAPVPYESYNEGQVAASEVKARPAGGQRYVQRFTPQSGINYKEAPVVIATDTLKDKIENIKYVENYKSGSDLTNNSPITNYSDGSSVIAQADNYSSDSGASNAPVPYESYNEDQAAASEVKARPAGGQRYVQRFTPQSGINYKEAPVVIATDTLKDQIENIKYVENYKSGSDLSNTAPKTKHVVSSPLIYEADNNNLDSIPSNLAHVNTKREAPVVISNILPEKPLARRYANNYRLGSGWSDIARDDSSNGAPEVIETVHEKSGKYEANYESDYGPKELVPINTDSGASSATTDTVLVNSGSNKHEKSNEAHHGSSSPTPLNTNPKQNVYQKLTSGITEFNLKSLVGNPDIQNILAGTNKRYVVVHSNGTVEYLDKLDLGPHQNSKLRLVHTKRKNTDDSDSEGVLTQQSPQNLLNNIAKNPEPVAEYPLPTNDQLGDDEKPTPLHVDQANPADEYDSNLSPPLKDLPVDHNNSKLLPSYVIPPADDDNSTRLTPNEDQSPQNDNLKPLPQDVNQQGNVDDSKPLTPHVSQSAVDGNSKPLPQNGNQPAEDDNSKLLTSKEDQPADNEYPKLDQPKDEKNFTPLSPNARLPAYDKKTKHSYVKHPANGHNSKPLATNENQQDNRPFHPNRKQPAHHNRLKHSHVNQPANNNNSNLSSPGENQKANGNSYKPLPANSGDEANFTSLLPHKKQQAHHFKSKDTDVNQPEDDNNSNLSSSDENQPLDGNNSTPLASNESHLGDGTHSKPLPQYKIQSAYHYKSKSKHEPEDENNSNSSSPDEDQPGKNKNFKPLPSNENQLGDGNDSDDTKSKPLLRDQSANDNNSNPSSPDENKKSKPNENQPTDNLKSKPTPAVTSKNDDQSNPTTVSPTVPNYTTSSKPQVIKINKRKHIHHKSTTNTPVVSTTPCPDDTLEDQTITLSPIEQSTDNVSDVPPVTATTTTTRPVKIPGKSDIINDANNKQDDVQDDTAQTYSTTTVSPSSSASPTDNISDDKTIGTVENNNTQTNDKTVVDQVIGKKDTQTAVYNSSELFDTNTDVPAESDDYSSITASPSVQNDVNTGDASGDNLLELEQSETDVTITVSSSTANDSEDEIITINIEISESTDADSSSNDKSLVVSIDTNDGSNDDSKTSKPKDFKKDHNNDDGRGKNVEIDMSNLKGEPTMWIRTTNQDFIDKLVAKNDTEFDMIYFFHIDNQPAIEREKATTIYCNGTIVTETTEITYANKDDPTPTIVKTTKIVQIEDYEAE